MTYFYVSIDLELNAQHMFNDFTYDMIKQLNIETMFQIYSVDKKNANL